jgi:hypothetical protein
MCPVPYALCPLALYNNNYYHQAYSGDMANIDYDLSLRIPDFLRIRSTLEKHVIEATLGDSAAPAGRRY